MTRAIFRKGMRVRTADGRSLGRIEEIAHGVDFLHVRSGLVWTRDWYVPVARVAAVEADTVTLTVDANEAQRAGWAVPPAAYLQEQGGSPGYDVTSRAFVPDAAEHSEGAESAGH